MAFRRSFLKHYTHSNIQLNNLCALWKSSEWWASGRCKSFQNMFFKTLFTCKHTIEQSMRSVKVHWGVGFKEKRWLSEVVFWNIIHIQTYNWTIFAPCESPVSGGLQAEAKASRRSFSKHHSHANIQLNKVCGLWKYIEWWASSRKKMAFRRRFSKHYTHSNIQLNKVCALGKYSEWWDSIRSNGFRKKFLKTLNTVKHTIEQSMRSLKVQWVLGFKLKHGLPEEVFSKHYSQANILLNKVCALWK